MCFARMFCVKRDDYMQRMLLTSTGRTRNSVQEWLRLRKLHLFKGKWGFIYKYICKRINKKNEKIVIQLQIRFEPRRIPQQSPARAHTRARTRTHLLVASVQRRFSYLVEGCPHLADSSTSVPAMRRGCCLLRLLLFFFFFASSSSLPLIPPAFTPISSMLIAG